MLLHSFAGDSYVECAAWIGLEPSQGRAMDPNERRRAEEERRREEAAERARKLAFCDAAWRETLPAAGSPVGAYLRSRGIDLPVPPSLRFHPALPLDYEGRFTAPAMVALVAKPSGELTGLHVTAIKPDGSGKARGDRSRRMFGDMTGSAIQLTPVPPSGELAVAEGIETALSWMQLTGRATWSIMSTSFLAKWRPPPQVRALTVAADGDKAGREAAETLVDRAKRQCATAIAQAPEALDWNDVLMERC